MDIELVTKILHLDGARKSNVKARRVKLAPLKLNPIAEYGGANRENVH